MIIGFLIIFLLAGCTEGTQRAKDSDSNKETPAMDCNYYCSQQGYGKGAVKSECITFTECNEPYEPISAEICSGIDLCCCINN